MFRKIVSSLPFSPALVGQLGFYGRRLRKEQAVRRLGLIFVILALIFQLFTIINPPQQALANTTSDIVAGGITSVSHILSTYDDTDEFKSLIDYFGITRNELSSVQLEQTCSSDHSIALFSRQHLFSVSAGEITHTIPTQHGVATFYSAPLYLYDQLGGTFCTESFVGTSEKVGWFSIIKNNGNLQLKQDLLRQLKNGSSCLEGDVAENCPASVTQTVESNNLTQSGKDADKILAKPGDRIEYIVKTTNHGNAPITTTVTTDIADILEYAIIFENGGSSMHEASRTLRWENVTIPANKTDARRFFVQVTEKIATTPRAGNNPSSYNCVMTNTYGNTINVRIDCPAEKMVERTVQHLPKVGVIGNIIFATILLLITFYLYIRNKLINKEIRLLKKEFDGGSL